MKKSIFSYLLFFAALFLVENSFAQRFWVSAIPSNWNNSANWSTTSGGAGGASVPGASDLVTFNASGLGNCTLDVAANVAGITVNGYTGIININGFNLTTTGTNTFTTGTINNGGGAAAVTLNTTTTTTFNGTTFGANVNGSTGRIFFNGSTFNGTVSVTKTDNNNDNSTGNNIFNGVTTITNLGGGQLLLGNGTRDQFNGITTFNNNGSYRFYFAYNHSGQTTTFASNVILNTNKTGGTDGWSFLIAESNNTNVSFGGNLTINCAGTLQSNHRILQGTGSTATYSGTVTINSTNSDANTTISMGVNGTSTYNGNIVVTNSGGSGGISFNNNTSASSTLAATRTISIAGSYGSGILSLERFIQLGATAQVLNTLSGTARLDIGPDAAFGGNVNFRAPRLFMNGGTFSGTATLEKTGANGDSGNGGNTFQGVTTISNSGSDELVLANTNPDVFNSAVTLNNTGTSRIQIGINSAGNTFNNGLTINHGGTASTAVNNIIARNAGSTATINGNLILNCTNGNTASGIIIANDGDVTVNGNVTVSSTNGRGVYFGNSNGTVTQAAGFSITNGSFNTGTLSFSRFTQNGSSANTLNLTGSSTLIMTNGSVFGGNATFSSPRLYLSGVSFNGTATLQKTGAGDDAGSGGNVFSGVTSITNSGSGYLMTGNGSSDQFNAATTFNNTGSYRIYFAHNHSGQTTTFASSLVLNSNKSGGADQWSYLIAENGTTAISFGGTVTINCSGSIRSDFRLLNGTGSSAIYSNTTSVNIINSDPSTTISLGQNGTSTYNGNITVSNTGGAGGITFNNNAAASSTLNGLLSIAGGFSSGSLNLYRFTQIGILTHNLSLTNGSILRVGPDSSFDGDVTFSSPQIYLNGATYKRTAIIEKTGATDNNSSGGNIFQGVTTITNSGSGEIFMGSTNGDSFGDVTTFNNTGSYRIRIAYNHGGQATTFASDVTLNSNKSGGTDPWSYLICDGTNTEVIFGGTLTINVAGTLRSDHRLLNGSGSQATFNGPVVINMTNTDPNTSVTMGQNGTSTYNGNITVTNTGGAAGINFNNSASASSTLNGSISIAGGFSSGSLNLYRFNQVGVINHNLTLTNGAALRIGPDSEFDGNVNFVAPQLYLNGCIYQGTGSFEKTEATNDAGTGGNIFTGATTITNSGSGYLLLGNGTRDQFLSTTTFNNIGSYRIYFAHNHGGQTTTFASDVIMNSNKTGGTDAYSFLVAENSNTNVSFGGAVTINCGGTIRSDHQFLNGSGSTSVFSGPLNINVTNSNPSTTINMGINGTSTYNGNIGVLNNGGASGITFNSGASSSSILNGAITSGTFSSGSLNLYRFTQVGVISENITLTNGSILRVGPNSSFDGNVNFIAPRLFLQGATYNGTAYLEKNGTGDDQGNGGNIFNGAATLVDSGSGYLMTANSSPDIFNGELTVTNSGSNWIFLAHNVAGNQFNNNITVNNTGSANGILFSNNASGAATFTNGTIAVGGSGFSVGDLRLRRFTQVGSIAQNVALTGSARLWIGPDSGFEGNVNFVAPQLLLNGATYNGTAYLEKNGATNDDGTGPNVFNQATTIVNSGSNYLLTASTSPDIFNGNLVVTNSGSSTIRLADNSTGNQFNGNIEVNSTFGGGIYFSNSGNGTSTLAAGKTIGVGTTGVISGDIRLQRFTQVGPTPQTLNLSGIAVLTLGPTSSFGGNVDFRSPQLLLNGTTYSGTAYLEKTGASSNNGNGGNTFNGTTSIVNSGSGYLLTANNSPDIFNGALTVTNTGSNIIYLAHNVTGSQFNGNISFNSTLGSGGIYFANNSTGDATIANGVSLLVGGLGYSDGELRFRRLTQIGTAPQTLLLTGTSLLRIGPSTTFNGNLDFRAPQFALDGSIYNGTTYLEKTGAGNNDSPGGNTFNGPTTIANSGSGWFRFALTGLDTFNGDLTLSNTGSSTIRMADNTPGTVFNGNIIVNSTFGGGIYFSESGGGTASLASGRTISVGGLGFSLGELRLRRFTQNGGTSQNLMFTGTAGLILGPSIIFNGAVDFRSPQLYIEGGSYNNTVMLEKTGAGNNGASGNSTFNSITTIQNSGSGVLRTNGNNTFNGVTSLINSGSADILLELTTASTYNGNVTLTNTGSSNIRMTYAGNTSFNGNIVVNSTSGTGIYFSESGAGSATLATGRTISVGGSGFTAGELRLQRFTQAGATAQNLVLTGSSTFRSGPTATWNGALIVSSPTLFLDGSILNGAANSLIKTGASTDSSIGGNTIGGNTTFTNSGTGIFRFANTTADDFTGNVTFNQASGTIQPAYNVASTFRGNVTVDGAAPITFGANNGTITFAGNAAQNVIKSGAASPVFRRLLMNKSGNAVTLATDVSVTTNATFTAGVLNTTTTNILSFVNGSTVTGGSNASHIDGPVVKIGNAAFSFPTGDNGIYRPVSISAPTTNTHAFRAEYFKAGQAFGGPSTYPAGILTVSSCEYWILDRTIGTSNVNVTLSWNSPDCTGAYITNLPTLRVVRWNGAAWADHGNGGTTGNSTAGTVITSAPITSFSPITLGSTTLSNPLPVELISFTGQVLNENVKLSWITASELNNDFFTLQRSVDGAEFESIAEIDGAGTKQAATEYEYIDTNPLPNLSYYRLRQTDFDKKFTYSKVIAVNVSLGDELSMHPNPVSYGTPLTLNRKGDYIILNNLGVTVLKVLGVNQIDISSLAPGVYTLRSSGGDIKRLVIQ
jgi:hypothetical protein